MISTTMNYWAVLVSAAAYMALGALWYSPILFGKAWMKGIGKTKEQVKADFSSINYPVAFIAGLLSAYGIARVLSWCGGASVADGVKLALLVGIAFIFAALVVIDTFEKKPRLLTFINVLYHIVGLIICGIIIGAWR